MRRLRPRRHPVEAAAPWRAAGSAGTSDGSAKVCKSKLSCMWQFGSRMRSVAKSCDPNFAQSADMLEGSRQHTDANETQSRTQPYLIQCVSQIIRILLCLIANLQN